MRTDRTGRMLHAAIAVCAWASLSAQTPAQTPTISPPATPALSFAGEPYVVKTASTVVSMNPDGTGTRVLTFAAMLQSEAALRQSSVASIAFASHSEHADFTYVRVVHPDGTIEETPVSSAIEQPAPVTQEAPLYSDLETKQIPVRSLRVGDTVEWQVRFTVDHPEVPNQSWGQDTFIAGAVVLDETYELRVPSTLHVTAWTNAAAHAEFTESDTAGTHIYRWHHSVLRPTVGPQADAFRKSEETRRRTPEEELEATKGALPSFAWTTFPDWATVGAWYRSLATDRAAPDDAIKAKVAELTAGKTSDLEKAQAVYAYVSAQIRYVGVDFGIGRYQPHTAAEVFANRYGDCKDKHTLLAAMLSVLNLHADPVLIGAGIRFNSAIPSPASFNHLITRLTLNGQPIWLDATSEIGAWGALLKPIRDQDALVIPQSAIPVIAHTPADLPYPQTNTFSLAGALDKDLTSDSKIVFTFHDDTELYLRAALHAISPANYSDFVQNLMTAMGFGGTTSDPSFEHLDDLSQPLQISFHYHRVKEKDWGENRITAIFQNIGVPGFSPDKPPTSAILLGEPRTETSTLAMQLPEGWSAELPEAVHAHAPFANCDVTYSVNDHVLTAERRLTVLKSKVSVDDFKQYQSWYDASGADGYPFIQLLPAPKVSAAATAAQPKAPDAAEPASPSDPKAADLIRQAAQSAGSMDLDSARKLLDQAAAINPKQSHLWSTYAGVAEMLGIQTQVLEDMERELSYHPDEVQYYSWVARGEAATGNSKAALSTLHAWVKAAPASPEAALALARRLMDDKSPADAFKEASDALDRLKSGNEDLTDLRIVAANAQVALGQASQAADAVAPLLKTATDPVQINDIAYILAEGSAHLTDAAAAQAKVLEISEAETANWTGTGNIGLAMELQSNIVSAWDTMGWILFHQGKFSEAYGYVNAALHGLDNKEVRDHLSAINAVIHNPVATATLRADNQKLRTFSLGPANGQNGVAFYTLLLADGKVIDSTVEKSANPNVLSSGAQFLKAANLHALFPPGSKAHLIRTGFVNCHSGICELVLSPFDRPRTVTLTKEQGGQIH